MVTRGNPLARRHAVAAAMRMSGPPKAEYTRGRRIEVIEARLAWLAEPLCGIRIRMSERPFMKPEGCRGA